MNQPERVERDLTAWFVDTAMPRMPDYVDEILGETERIRQRPRWTFVTRWLPAAAWDRGLPVGARLPWRTMALVALLMLLAAAAAIYVGSQPRVPPPFGLAANGLFAYSQDGDLFLLDRSSNVPRPLTAGGEMDTDPRWSLDGTKVAFLRNRGGTSHELVVADLQGGIHATSKELNGADPDSITWSPDGRHIAIGVQHGSVRVIVVLDALTSSQRELAVDYEGYEFYWRPPDGRDLLLSGRPAGLLLVNAVNGSPVPLAKSVDSSSLRPLGWTPDGRAFLYQATDGGPPTHVFDPETSADRQLDLSFGHLSNDGTRAVGMGLAGRRLCVQPINGGRCAPVSLPADVEVAFDYGAGIAWSPDDRWLVVSDHATQHPWLVDPAGRVDAEPLDGYGTVTIQRVAP
jgi:dipeptidyl aminopeptidase/acylaminoacyl peptidase